MAILKVVMLSLAGSGLAARINHGTGKASSAMTAMSEDGSWTFGFVVKNFRGARIPSATVIIDAPGLKKKTCTADEHGVLCIKMPSNVDKVTWEASADTCSTDYGDRLRSKYCRGSQICVMQSILNGFGNRCQGTGEFGDEGRSNQEDKDFCSNILKTQDDYGCRDWKPSNSTTTQRPGGGGGIIVNPSRPRPRPTPSGQPGASTGKGHSCPAAIEISGGDEHNSIFAKDGIYVDTGLIQVNRPVYAATIGNQVNYMYYWSQYGSWCISSDYKDNKAGVRSDYFQPKQCPTAVTQWYVYKGQTWSSSEITARATSPPTSTPEPTPEPKTTPTTTPENGAPRVHAVQFICLAVLSFLSWH